MTVTRAEHPATNEASPVDDLEEGFDHQQFDGSAADIDPPATTSLRPQFRWGLAALLTSAPILVAIGIVVAVTSLQGGGTAVSTPESKPVRVGVSRVGSIPAPTLSTKVRGVVLPRRESALAFRRSGRVKSVMVNAGDVVKKDEPIAMLDISDLTVQASLADSDIAVAEAMWKEAVAGPRKETIAAANARVNQLKAQANSANSRWQRRRQLYERAAIFDEELEDARLEVDQFAASLEEAEAHWNELLAGTRDEQIEAANARVKVAKAARQAIDVQKVDSKIVAPYDCVIAERFIDEGAIAGPNQVIVTVLEQPPLEARFGVPADAALRLHINDELPVSIGKNADSLVVPPVFSAGYTDGRFFQAKVVRMQPRVDSVTQTREAVVEFVTDEIALVGQPATLWLSDSVASPEGSDTASIGVGRSTFWVPSDALVRGVRGLWGLYVAKPAEPSTANSSPNETLATVSLYDAEVIRTAGSMTLVAASLTADDWIITEGTHRIGPDVEVIASTHEGEVAGAEQ